MVGFRETRKPNRTANGEKANGSGKKKKQEKKAGEGKEDETELQIMAEDGLEIEV